MDLTTTGHHTKLIKEQIKRMREAVQDARTQQLDLLNSELNLLNAKKLVMEQSREISEHDCADRKPNMADLRALDLAIRDIESKQRDIEELSRLNPDTISRMALPYTIEALERLAVDRPEVNPSYRIVAMVARFNVVQDMLQRFREEHSDWAVWMPAILCKRRASGTSSECPSSISSSNNGGNQTSLKRSKEDPCSDNAPSSGKVMRAESEKLQRRVKFDESSVNKHTDSEPVVATVRKTIENNIKVTIRADDACSSTKEKRVIAVKDSVSGKPTEALRHRNTTTDGSSSSKRNDKENTSKQQQQQQHRHEKEDSSRLRFDARTNTILRQPRDGSQGNQCSISSRVSQPPVVVGEEENQVKEMQRYLDSVVQDRVILRQEVHRLEDERKALLAKLKDRTADNSKLTMTLQELNFEMKELKLANENMVNQLKMEENRGHTLEDEIQLLKQQLSKETELREVLTVENQQLKAGYEEQLNSLEQRLTEAESMVEQEKVEQKKVVASAEELEAIHRLVHENGKHRESLASELKTLQEMVCMHETRIEASQKALCEKDREIEQLRAKIEPLEAKAKNFMSFVTKEMDKTLANQQVVNMRKHARIARKNVIQKWCKQINVMKRKIVKHEESGGGDGGEEIKRVIAKLKRKLQAKQGELVELKHLNPDQISKLALAHDESHLDSVIAKSNSSVTDRLLATVARNKAVQTLATKFKEENPNCDQWLPVAFELWEEKKKFADAGGGAKKRGDKVKVTKATPAVVKPTASSQQSISSSAKTSKREASPKKQNGATTLTTTITRCETKKTPKTSKTPKGVARTPSRSYTPKFQVTELEGTIENASLEKVAHSKAALITRLDLQALPGKESIFEKKENVDEEKVEQESDDDADDEQPKASSSRVKDKFFLTGNGDDDDDDDDEEFEESNDNDDEEEDGEEEELFQEPTKNQRNKSQFINLKAKPQAKRFQNGQGGLKSSNKGQSGRLFDRQSGGGAQSQSAASFGRQGSTKNKSAAANDQKLHPSWKARMEAKQKQKILLDNPMAKRITFE